MHSAIEYSGPRVSGTSDFTDIFLGTVKEHLADDRRMIDPTRAKVVPSAVRFFKGNVPRGENPISVLEKSFEGQSPFLPGTSLISMPVVEKPQYTHAYDKNSEWARAADTRMSLKMGDVKTCLDRNNWARIFGQIPSAALIVAEERGFDPTIMIPSFDNKFPNYFRGLALNYMPEGLEVGTILIDGDVGDYCGKYSSGGRIVVNGDVGRQFGDVSRNVEYIVRESASKPTQVRDCNFYVGLTFREGMPGGTIREFVLDELKKNGCNLHEWVNFTKKDILKKSPNMPLEKMLTVRKTQSQ